MECLGALILRGKWWEMVALLKGSARSKPRLKIKPIHKLPACAKFFSSLCPRVAGQGQGRVSVRDRELFAIRRPFLRPPLKTSERPRTLRCLGQGRPRACRAEAGFCLTPPPKSGCCAVTWTCLSAPSPGLDTPWGVLGRWAGGRRDLSQTSPRPRPVPLRSSWEVA